MRTGSSSDHLMMHDGRREMARHDQQSFLPPWVAARNRDVSTWIIAVVMSQEHSRRGHWRASATSVCVRVPRPASRTAQERYRYSTGSCVVTMSRSKKNAVVGIHHVCCRIPFLARFLDAGSAMKGLFTHALASLLRCNCGRSSPWGSSHAPLNQQKIAHDHKHETTRGRTHKERLQHREDASASASIWAISDDSPGQPKPITSGHPDTSPDGTLPAHHKHYRVLRQTSSRSPASNPSPLNPYARSKPSPTPIAPPPSTKTLQIRHARQKQQLHETEARQDTPAPQEGSSIFPRPGPAACMRRASACCPSHVSQLQKPPPPTPAPSSPPTALRTRQSQPRNAIQRHHENPAQRPCRAARRG